MSSQWRASACYQSSRKATCPSFNFMDADNVWPTCILWLKPREWFSSRGIQVHVSDYAKSSLLGILSEIKATLLVSLLHDNNPNAMVTVNTFGTFW